MSSQELVELQKIKKAILKQTKAVRKKAKKIKVKDLLGAESVNERIKAFLDKMTLDDLLQLSAIIGVTLIIKGGIDFSTSTLQRISKGIRILAKGHEYSWGTFPNFFLFVPTDTEVGAEEQPTPEWLEWLIAFGLAYIIVKHFPSIVEVGGDIIGTATKILGSLASG